MSCVSGTLTPGCYPIAAHYWLWHSPTEAGKDEALPSTPSQRQRRMEESHLWPLYPSRSRSLSWTFTLVIFFYLCFYYTSAVDWGKQKNQDCRQKPSSGTIKAFRQLESQFLLWNMQKWFNPDAHSNDMIHTYENLDENVLTWHIFVNWYC